MSAGTLALDHEETSRMAEIIPAGDTAGTVEADWQRRVVGRSLQSAAARSVDRSMNLIRAASTVLERANGEDITVQEVADEAGQSLRTLYQYFASKDDLLLAVFEEAMILYAGMVRDAIADLDAPLERLAGALLAASRMPEATRSGVERGLSRLRLKLSEVDPELVGRTQASMTALFSELVAAAATAEEIDAADVDSVTFLLLGMNATYITSESLGNDAGVARPDLYTMVGFCLRGVGADVDRSWIEAVDGKLHLPKPRTRTKAKPKKVEPKKAPARKA